jgi:predicted Zn-dependent protease
MHMLCSAGVKRILVTSGWVWLLGGALLVSGCAVNPVTGERELSLVTPQQELDIGAKQYLPSQQMQGGLYRVDPAVGQYVSDIGNRVAVTSGVALPYEFVVLNNSIPNAWALPGGKIAVNRGLLVALDNEAELAAVLGHEVTHAAARHSASQISKSTILQAGVLGAAVLGGSTQYGDYIVGGAQQAAQLFTFKYGRDAEREADYYGTLYLKNAGYDPQASVTLQETFVELSKGRQSDWLSGLFASHPPSQERVDNNRLRVAELGAGGDLGAARYRAVMAELRSDQAAYDALDKGRKALADDDLAVALASAQKAISLQNAEAAVHGLRGDVRLAQKRYGDAVINYNRAIERDPQYFAYYLARGLSHAEQNERNLARTDLEKSVQLLPTSTAYNALGQLAEADGNTDQALRYYKIAAGSEGPAGEAARARYLAIDVPRRPAEYAKARVALDANNQPVLEISNGAGMDLVDLSFQVRLQWADGKVTELSPRIERLAKGERRLFELPKRSQELTGAEARAVKASLAP